MNINTVIYDLRHQFDKNGWIMLVYYLIMNVSVTVAVFVDELLLWVQYLLKPDSITGEIEQIILDRAARNGWGYLLACLMGGIILLFWKKPGFCFKQIWVNHERMSVKAFTVLFCAFISCQAIQILLTPVIEWLLNLIGLSAMSSLKAAIGGTNSVSMFLYVAIFAPIFEEVLFRGLILQNLLPYGKKFAIIGSAFLFGVFHGNLLQSPYAFLSGLVLGYAAIEYGLIWPIVLHMFNNFVLGDLATRIAKVIPVIYVDLALYIFIFGCAVATLAIAAVKSKQIAEYISNRKIHPLCLKGFFSSRSIIAFTILMAGNMIFLLFI